jgi:inner membrane protease ATP23
MTTDNDKPQLSPSEMLNGFEWWKRSLQYRCGLGISEQEKRQFEFDYQNKDLPAKCKACDEYKEWMLRYSPSVTFMMGHVAKLTKDGLGLDPTKIVCDVCDDVKGGGFHPEVGILLCSNWIRSKWQLEDILIHELVHVYDYLKFNVNLKNLNHHACTEIRASMLSGECRIFNEIKKTGLGNFGAKFQDCIKRRAILSVAANPNCKDTAEAEKVVNNVWPSCFNDTRPFERVYR